MFESKLPKVGNSIFSEMSALANKHDAVNLAQGFPEFLIHPELRNALIEGVDENQVQYAPMPGRQDLRKGIADKILKQRNIQVDANTEITVTAGATQAIYTVFAATLNRGDEVVLFDPAYDCYDPSIRLNGGIPIHLNLTFPSFKIDWQQLKAAVNSKTKMIVINNPHNPSGSVLTVEDLFELEKLIDAHPQLMILSDEVYEHIQYNGPHQSILGNKKLRDRSFVVYSFGKSMHVTGWKLGYCIAPENYTVEFRKVHQYLIFCANNTIQFAVAKFLNEREDWRNNLPLFQAKKDLFLSAIKNSRFKIIPCEGTYFCLLDYSEISNKSDVDFAKELTINYGIATIPISVFYQDETDNKLVRICFAKNDETLLNAARILCKI